MVFWAFCLGLVLHDTLITVPTLPRNVVQYIETEAGFL